MVYLLSTPFHHGFFGFFEDTALCRSGLSFSCVPSGSFGLSFSCVPSGRVTSGPPAPSGELFASELQVCRICRPVA
jgi:hypothetical protein